MTKKFSTKLIPVIEVSFAHQWESWKKDSQWYLNKWRKKELGISFEKSLLIGKPSTGMAVSEIFTEKNFINAYSFGISLVVCKLKIVISFNKLFEAK